MHFPAHAAAILFLSIFGHKIGDPKSPALFQGKELQVTRFKVTFFCLMSLSFFEEMDDYVEYLGSQSSDDSRMVSFCLRP